MGEKFDGIRTVWNPIRGKLYSRKGTVMEVMLAYTKLLPVQFLDGEIWLAITAFLVWAQILILISGLDEVTFICLLGSYLQWKQQPNSCCTWCLIALGNSSFSFAVPKLFKNCLIELFKFKKNRHKQQFEDRFSQLFFIDKYHPVVAPCPRIKCASSKRIYPRTL